jgi:coatomer protein complex subunit gamma
MAGGAGNPFHNLEKTSVLQEARAFNETPVNPRKCTHILTKILYLINQGDTLGTREATEAFFAMTKLFQSKDVILRRMVYLGKWQEFNSSVDVRVSCIFTVRASFSDFSEEKSVFRPWCIRSFLSYN